MTEAERLADLFELEEDPESLYRQAAAELRRLSKVEAQVEALKVEANQANSNWSECAETCSRLHKENERQSAKVEALRKALQEIAQHSVCCDARHVAEKALTARPGGRA